MIANGRTPTPPQMRLTEEAARLEWQRVFTADAIVGAVFMLAIGSVFLWFLGALSLQLWESILFRGQWSNLLFAAFVLPFLFVSIGAIGMCLLAQTGGERIQLADGELLVEWTLFGRWVVRRQRMQADDIQDVKLPEKKTPHLGFIVRGGTGKRVRLGLCLPGSEEREIASAIASALGLPDPDTGVGRYHPDAPPAQEIDAAIVAAALQGRITLPADGADEDKPEGDTLVQLRVPRPGCSIAFMSVWLAFWSIGVVMGWHKLIVTSDTSLLLPMLAMSAFELMAAVILGSMAFGSRRLRIGRHKLVLEHDGMGWWRAENTLHAADVTRIELDRDTRLDLPADERLEAVRVVTLGGKWITLAQNDRREFREALAALLRRWQRANGSPQDPDEFNGV